jgi:surface antigen
VNDKAPIWLGRAVGSGQWAESLVDFVNAARASNQKNAVVNLSLDLTQVNPDGSVTTRYELTPAERSALEYARQSNVLVVVAAGNDGGVMSALGQASQEFDNIITVGAADGVNRAAYSSYGYGLDILAPGGTEENPMLSTVGDGVGTMAGTSVTSAKVTGAVSQVWAANPALSYRQVIEILKSTATDLDKPNWDEFTAAGLLNLAAAVLLAKVTTPLEYEAPASVVPETWSGEGKVTPSDRAAAVPMWPTVEPTSFTGRVMATIGANVRSGPGTSYPIVGSRSYNSYVNFNGWTYGERITDIALGTPDERWYRIAGTNQWIASAIIDGNAPGSTPLPPGNSGGGGIPLPQPRPQVPINSNSANYRDGRVNPFAYRWQGQCTWYTYGRMLETGLLPAGTKANNWFLGDAWTWRRDAQRAGLPITSTPTPGARGIVVWPPYTKGTLQWGHVAFLEEVYPDGRIRISESNWAGKGISERILTPAQYSGLSFVRLENATPNPRYSSPPAQPGKQREYRVRSGDTLSVIAYRELGNANRWREIKKADGSTFTDAEARNLQVGMSVYLPVSYQTGPGTPVKTPPSSKPKITLIRTGGGDGPSLSDLTNTAKTVWDVVKDNRPVATAQSDFANAIPQERSWEEMTGWNSQPQIRRIRYRAGNLFGGNQTDIEIIVLWYSGGSYQGQGKFINNATVLAKVDRTSWGNTVNITASIKNPFNQGTEQNPLAVLPVTITINQSNVLYNFTSVIEGQVRGDGSGNLRYL